MKKIIAIISLCVLISACTDECVTSQEDLNIRYWLSDSLGIEKDVFAINEVIWAHFSVTNNSDEDIIYHTSAEVMCAFLISLKVPVVPETDEQFMPPLIISEDLIQKPGVILEDSWQFTEGVAGKYILNILPFLVYDRSEMNKDSQFEIEFTIVEE